MWLLPTREAREVVARLLEAPEFHMEARAERMDLVAANVARADERKCARCERLGFGFSKLGGPPTRANQFVRGLRPSGGAFETANTFRGIGCESQPRLVGPRARGFRRRSRDRCGDKIVLKSQLARRCRDDEPAESELVARRVHGSLGSTRRTIGKPLARCLSTGRNQEPHAVCFARKSGDAIRDGGA